MDSEMRDLLNMIISRQQHVMLLLTMDATYLLRDHHKYLDPEDAPKIKLGKRITTMERVRPSNRIPQAKLLYITEKWK